MIVIVFCAGVVIGMIGVFLIFEAIRGIEELDRRTERRQREKLGWHIEVVYYLVTDLMVVKKHDEVVASCTNVSEIVDRYHPFTAPELGIKLVDQAGDQLTKKEAKNLIWQLNGNIGGSSDE